MAKFLMIGEKPFYDHILLKFGDINKLDAQICTSLFEAKKIYEENDVLYDIIVMGKGMNEKEGKDFFNYILEYSTEKKSTLPIFLWITSISHQELGEMNFHGLNLLNKNIPRNPENLENYLIDAIQITLEDIKSEASRNFNRVSIDRLHEHNYLNADLYVKLSDIKFIKIINAYEFFSPDAILKYQQKGMQYLFVKTDDYIRFSDFLYNSLRAKFKMGSNTIEEAIEEDLAVSSLIVETLMNLKVDEDTVKTLNDIANSSIKLVKKLPSIKDILNKLILNQSYTYSHGLLTSYISNLIAMKMKWTSVQTLQKLSIASIVHDVCLEEDKLALVESLSELDPNRYSLKEITLIKKHPLMVKEILDRLKDLPPDVSSIVFTHHELPDGKGFPRGINAQQISQIGALFNIAEDFSRIMYKDNNLNRERIFKLGEEFKEKYSIGNYLHPCEGLLKILNELI